MKIEFKHINGHSEIWVIKDRKGWKTLIKVDLNFKKKIKSKILSGRRAFYGHNLPSLN